MVRRLLAAVMVFGALSLTAAGTGGLPASGAVSVGVPSTIDAGGTVDVTDALNRFLASVKPGSTVTFPDHGRYRTDGIVALTHRTDVTVEGNGSTLFTAADATIVPATGVRRKPHWPRNRMHLAIRDSTNVTIHNLVVEGSNRTGTYRAELEAQAGFVVARSQRITLDGVTARATFGDGVYVVGKSADVTIRHCTLDHNGRQGVAIVGGERVTVDDCTIADTGRSAVDLEPGHGFVKTVHIQNNRVSRATNFLLAAVGAGVGVQDVWLERNRVEGGKGVSVYAGTPRAVRPGIHVIDNTGSGTSAGYQGALIWISRFDGIEVRGNHQRVAAGVTAVVLHDSCNDTITGNDFAGAKTTVTRDGTCTTPFVGGGKRSAAAGSTRPSPSTSGARRRPRPVPSTVAPAPAPTPTSGSRGTAPTTVVLAVAIGALAGAGGTLLAQWARRNREPDEGADDESPDDTADDDALGSADGTGTANDAGPLPSSSN